MDIWHDPLFLAALKKGGAGGTASGDIVSFYAPKAAPLRALTLSIDPVQDLHGFDAPWPGGGGKNLFDVSVIPLLSGEQSSGTVFRDSSGNISVKASASSGGTAVYVGGTPGYMLLKDCAPNLRVGGTYTLSFDTTGTQKIIYLSVSARSWNEGTSITITQDDLDSRVYFYASGVSTSATISKFQIEEGSTATTYAPYSNLCPISGHTGANVWRTGVNVWDEEWVLGYWNHGNNGTFVSNNNYFACKNKIRVLPNTEYFWVSPSVIREMLFYDASENLISYSPYSAVASSSFTTPAKCEYITFYYATAYGNTYNHDISINYPSTDHDYHAYTGTSIPVTWSEAGTVYGGTWDVLNGMLRVTHAGVDMGTLSWGKGTTQSATYGEYAYFTATPSPAKALNFNFISSCYKTARTHRNALENGEMGVSNTNTSGYKSFAVRNDAYADSTGTEFATAMSGQTIVYELATPLTYTLTPAQLDTLVGTNVVWGDTGEVSLEYAGGGVSKDMMLAAILHEARQ